MDKFEKICDSLLNSTNDGAIKWKENTTHIFSSDTSKYFEYKSPDGNTEFQINIKLCDDLKYDTCSLLIRNEKLLNGARNIFSEIYPELKSLGEVIYQNDIKPNITKGHGNNQAADEILCSIETIKDKRNQKLENLLNTGLASKIKNIIKSF